MFCGQDAEPNILIQECNHHSIPTKKNKITEAAKKQNYNFSECLVFFFKF